MAAPPSNSDRSDSAAEQHDDNEQLGSRLHLPPHALASPSAAYEGDTPNILADSLLLRPAPPGRTPSWRSLVAPPDSDHTAARHPSESPSRSRPRPRPRTRHWTRTPSPAWFFPGTFLLAVSGGMILAPKLEIYTQLVCRAMPVEKSRVTLPPPILDAQPQAGPPLVVPPSSSNLTAQPILFEWTPAPHLHSHSIAGDLDSDGDSWSLQCQKSSAVQAAVAQLALVLSLMMGILSSLTTGWWGAFSDRRGRKPVLLLALLGTVMMDSVFLLTVRYHHILTYNFLFIGPFLDGLLGGWATAQATVSAYISDCTSPGSRARVFSLLGGCLMGGFALGPLLGSALISLTGGHVLAPFYAALGLHCAFWLVLALVLPESLEEERQLRARERHALDKQAQREKDQLRANAERESGAGLVRRTARRALRALKGAFAFLEPLGLLLPRGHHAGEQDDEELRTNIEWGAHLDEYAHPEEVWRGKAGSGDGAPTRKRDWALTRIALAYACNMALIGVLTVKLLYARTVFGWAPATTGYFLSYTGFLRLVTLLLVLPLAIKLLRRRPVPSPSRARPPSPASTDASATPTAEQKAWDAEARWLKIVSDSHFDLSLARSSLALDLAGFTLFLSAPLLAPPRGSTAHTAVFLLAVLVQSLGSGASPALQSLALAHAAPRDAGRLFASLSVVQALAAQVVSPVLFAAVFSSTVGGWKEGIFALAVALSGASLLALGGVRLRRVFVPPRGDDEAGESATTAVEVEAEGDREAQGRKSRSSVLPQSGFAAADEGDEEGRGRGRARERRGSAPALAAYRD